MAYLYGSSWPGGGALHATPAASLEEIEHLSGGGGAHSEFLGLTTPTADRCRYCNLGLGLNRRRNASVGAVFADDEVEPNPTTQPKF